MKIFKVLATLCVVSLALGLSDIGDEMFSGLCRAAAGVLFAAAYITFMLYKAEHIHGEEIESDYEHYYVPHTVAHVTGFHDW